MLSGIAFCSHHNIFSNVVQRSCMLSAFAAVGIEMHLYPDHFLG